MARIPSIPVSRQLREAVMFSDARWDPIDSDFCMGELNKAISRLKANKTPGPDKILNEYVKILGDNWKNKLLDF